MADRYQQLRREIEHQVELDQSTIRLGDRDFVWHCVKYPERLLEAAAEATTQQQETQLDPFWAGTWRAAVGLDQFLSGRDLAGVRILELGCGSGQAGVGAAARGGLVTMTDIVTLALQVAELNGLPIAENLTYAQLDWSAGKLDQPAFPLVIGSDLVYDTSYFPALSQCVRRHLAPGGTLLLGEPHRHTGDLFAQWIRRDGWTVREHDLDLHDARGPIRIFECQLAH